MDDTATRLADRADRQVWEALDRAHRTLDQVQAWGQLGFWDLDLETDELYWSTQVFEILGMDEPSLDGFLARIPADDQALVLQVAHRAQRQPGPYRAEHRFHRGDDVLVLGHRIQSVPGADGIPERVLGVITDITHVRALEAELETSVAIRNIGLAASSLLHDFKNQLAIVLGHCKLALDAVDDGRPPMREGLEAIQRAATQGVDLTRQVLDLGRSPSGAARPTDPAPILERVAALTCPIAGRRGAITVADAGGAGPVLADADRLEHVLVDLVVNATEAVRRTGGKISLGYAEVDVGSDDDPGLAPGRYGAFRVTDDGEGMDEETRSRAVQPYFSTKPRGEGSGVGLLSADAFARTSGGSLRIASTPGVGTTVELLLPLAPEAPGSSSAVRVVVLVGDRSRRERLVRYLRQDGIQAVVAADWADVRRYLDTEPIDAVAVDGDPGEGLAMTPVPIVFVEPGCETDAPAAVRSRVPMRR